ncbi:hypothetical protein MRX96_047538 [Rhipicephalus microplus]
MRHGLGAPGADLPLFGASPTMKSLRHSGSADAGLGVLSETERPPTWTLLRDLDWMNETPMGCAWLIWTLSEMRACCLVVGLSVTSGACCGIDTCCHVV